MMGKIPDEAVQAAKDVMYHANPNDVERALTAAAPHLAAVRVKKLEWGEIRHTDDYSFAQDAETSIGRYIAADNGWFLRGQSGWKSEDNIEAAKSAAQADYEARIPSAIEPAPSTRKELLKQIREGTAPGFINDGANQEGNPDLDCPYCGGSGHKGDVTPSPRAQALEEAAEAGKAAVMKFRKKVNGKYYPGYHEDMRDEVATAIRALGTSREPLIQEHSTLGAQSTNEPGAHSERERALEEAAQVAEAFRNNDWIAHDIRTGAFPKQSEPGVAIAAAIRALSSPDHSDAGHEQARDVLARFRDYVIEGITAGTIMRGGEHHNPIWQEVASVLHAAAGKVEGGGWLPTHRHKKRGTEYRVIGNAQVQCSDSLTDYEVVTVYVGQDNQMWVRRAPEFEDGRFETLSSHPVADGRRYRLIEDGETIEEADEFIEDDAVTWSSVTENRWAVGARYNRNFKAIRRPLPASPGASE